MTDLPWNPDTHEMTDDGFIIPKHHPLKLDLGAGAVSPPGFTPCGNGHAQPHVFPLPYGDNSVDEIRASHVLEHFPHGLTTTVLTEWARVLKPGCVMRVAVPNFEKIAEQYVEGVPQNTQGYVMGGQVDGADFHKVVFDPTSLKKAFAMSGLMLIRPWTSELQDCASLPISLNLQATKPHQTSISTSAVMSVPRLGFMDNQFTALDSIVPLGIKIRSQTGAFWEQCLERTIDDAIEEENPDLILSLDYDSVFVREDLKWMLQLMCCYPHVDVLAPVQSGRGGMNALFSIHDDDGKIRPQIPVEHFDGDLTPVATAHFGCTLFRANKLKELPRPWLWSQPAPDGSWRKGKTDADIFFWNAWRNAGNSIYLAPRIVIGHLELMVTWPGQDGHPRYQRTGEWREHGKPTDIWS